MNNSGGNASNAESWLSTTNADVDLQSARERLAELERTHIDKVLSSLCGSFPFDVHTVAMMQAKRSYALSRLKELIAPQHITDETVGAALLLCGLCEKSGREYASHILRTGCDQHRERMLAYIAEETFAVMWKKNWDSYRDFLINDEVFVGVLLELLDDRDSFLVVQAIRVCRKLQVPDVFDRFLGMLRIGNVTDLQRLAMLECLADYQLSKEVFEAALKLCEDQKISGGELLSHLADDVLGKFAIAANAPIKSRATQCLKNLIAHWLDTGEKHLGGIGVGGVLVTLCESADFHDLPWLRRVMRESAGQYYPKAPLVALIRIVPEEGRRILFEWMSQKSRQMVALWAARDAYLETEDAELISALQSMAEKANPQLLWWILNSLRYIGGHKAFEAISDQLPRLTPGDAEYFRRLSDRSDPTVLLTAVEVSDVLHPISVQKLRASWNEYHDSRQSHSPNMFEVFQVSDSCVSFDLATMQSDSERREPAKWNKLSGWCNETILRFATASSGMFRPDNVLAEFPDSATDGSIVSPVLSFIHAGRLYTGQLQSLYDISRISKMINAALNDVGVSYRFVELALQNQFSTFVFAQPDLLAPLAQRFHIPLSDNLEDH